MILAMVEFFGMHNVKCFACLNVPLQVVTCDSRVSNIVHSRNRFSCIHTSYPFIWSMHIQRLPCNNSRPWYLPYSKK